MLFENNMPFLLAKILITVFGTFAMMCTTAKLKCSRKRIAAIFLVFLLYVMASSAAIIHFFGYLRLLRGFVFTISFPSILILHKVSEIPSSSLIFARATHILFSVYIAMSVTLINTALHGSMISDLLLRAFFYGLAIFLECQFLRYPFLQSAGMNKKEWNVLSLIPCSLLLLTMVIALYPVHYTKNPSGVVLIYLFGAMTVVIYYATFLHLNMQHRFQVSERNRELLKLQVDALKEKAMEAAAAAEKDRIERHDTRHKFQTIAALIEEGDIEEALDYIRQSILQCNVPKPVHYCNNPILNATLSSYLGQAAAEHIRLDTGIDIPDTLPVDLAELSSVFANALENALKACRGLPEGKRQIILRCIHKPKFMLEISNTYAGDVTFSTDGFPVSADAGHGIGTRSIMAFCRKYDAFYSFSAKDGWFTLTIVL